MAEKIDLSLSNQEALVFGEKVGANSVQNDPERSNLERNQNYQGQIADLFSELKLSMDELKKSKEMKIYPITTNATESGSRGDRFSLAGKIISVIPNLFTVLVQPALIKNSLLNVGTNLFIKNSKVGKGTENFLFLGKLEEVFGNVKSPLYAVRSSPEKKFAKAEDDVFYSSSDPSTTMFYIELGNTGRSEIIYHR